MGLILKHTAFHGDAAPFIMELPAYRLPAPRNVARQLWDKAGDFLKRAFTVISVSYTHLDVYKRQARFRGVHRRSASARS